MNGTIDWEPERRWRRTLAAKAWLWRGPAVLALVVLAVSELTTDRVAALQAAWWVPRVLLAGFAVVWLSIVSVLPLAPRHPAERRRSAAWLVLAVFALGAAALREGRLGSIAPPDRAVQFVHWNAGNPAEAEAEVAVESLLGFDADLVLLTDPGGLLFGGRRDRIEEAGYRVATAGRFGLLSRSPVLEARPALASRARVVSRFRVDTEEGPMTIDGVDLPSAPSLPRFELTRALAVDLSRLETSAGDVIAGDFNISRGSASLTNLASDAVEAFGTAGVGWGGSYPRELPLWPIDLTLVRKPWQPVLACYEDLGAGRHRAQRVWLERSE